MSVRSIGVQAYFTGQLGAWGLAFLRAWTKLVFIPFISGTVRAIPDIKYGMRLYPFP